MKILRRLILWVSISSVPTCVVILVWLLSFQSFELLAVVRDEVTIKISTFFTLAGLIAAIILPNEMIEDMIS
jgi:hypothetical protein